MQGGRAKQTGKRKARGVAAERIPRCYQPCPGLAAFSKAAIDPATALSHQPLLAGQNPRSEAVLMKEAICES